MSELVKKEQTALSAISNQGLVFSGVELTARREMMTKVVQNQFVKDVDYGIIPGTSKKTKNERGEWIEVGRNVLLQAGAEKFLSIFQIGSDPAVEDMGDGFDHRFRAKVRLFSMVSGQTLGYGMGEASTKESKWAWKVAICDEEFNETPENLRRTIWKAKKDDRGYAIKKDGKAVCEKIQQVRQYPHDQLETVIQIAIKRALVKACRTVLACSDMFEQDLEEEHLRGAVMPPEDQPRQQYQQPQKTGFPPEDQPQPETGNSISEAQAKRLFAIGKGKKLTNEELSFIVYQSAGVNHSKDIPRDKYEATIAAIEAAEPGKVM